MAKKKSTYIPPKSSMDMTWDELYENREKHDNFIMEIYGNPTREFEVGENVIYGNLSNVTIAHVYGNGVYALNIPRPAKVDKNAPDCPERWIKKWVDIYKIKPIGETKFVNEMYRRPNISQSDMSTIIHMNSHNGFVMDDRFQRGYVWTHADRESLLDTIFNQGNIGSFLFNRHFGYDFIDSDEVQQFHTISGETISIAKKDNFCISVIDGQQRISTLMNYYLNRWAYKGYFYSQLSGKDKMTFTHFPIAYALVDESEGWNLKDWVWLFLQANKGVSQSPEHLVKMEEYYKGLK
jgi:hypothetical protein